MRRILSLVGIVTDSTPAMVCTELMSNGNLKTFLRDCRPTSLTLPKAVIGELEMHQMASRLASAMAFLERRGVIHRDIAVRLRRPASRTVAVNVTPSHPRPPHLASGDYRFRRTTATVVRSDLTPYTYM